MIVRSLSEHTYWCSRVVLDVELVSTWAVEPPANGSGIGLSFLDADAQVRHTSLRRDEVWQLIEDLQEVLEESEQ